jgi:tetratricopeptide (TPR) repeat protein
VAEQARLLEGIVASTPASARAWLALARARFLLLDDAGVSKQPLDAIRTSLDAAARRALDLDATSAGPLLDAALLAGLTKEDPLVAALLARIPRDDSEAAKLAAFESVDRNGPATAAETNKLVLGCPSFATPWLGHGNALLAAGKEVEAIKAWRSLLEARPSPRVFDLVLSHTLGGKREKTAGEIFAWALAAWPRSPWVYERHWFYVWGRHDRDAALEDARRLIEIGDETGYRLAAGAAFGETGDHYEEGLRAVEDGLGHAKDSNVRSLLLGLRAGMRSLHGELDAARDDATGAAPLAVSQAATTQLAVITKTLVDHFLDDRGDVAAAQQLLDVMAGSPVAKSPAFPRAQIREAVARSHLEEAETLLASVAVAPGEARATDPDVDAARKSVDERLASLEARAASGDEDALRERVAVLVWAGAKTRALKEADAVVSGKASARTKAHALRLATNVHGVSAEEVSALLARAGELAPDDPCEIAIKALSHGRQHEVAPAREEAAEALRRATDDPTACFLSALALTAIQDDVAARAACDQCIALEPGALGALRVRVAIDRRLGDFDAGIRDFRACAAVEPVPLAARIAEKHAAYLEKTAGK